MAGGEGAEDLSSDVALEAASDLFAGLAFGHRNGKAYIRFVVADRPGVLAEIAAAMRDAGVSIESLIQRGEEESAGNVLVSLVTHECPQASVTEALRLLEGSASLSAPPLVMHILGE